MGDTYMRNEHAIKGTKSLVRIGQGAKLLLEKRRARNKGMLKGLCPVPPKIPKGKCDKQSISWLSGPHILGLKPVHPTRLSSLMDHNHAIQQSSSTISGKGKPSLGTIPAGACNYTKSPRQMDNQTTIPSSHVIQNR